MLQKSIIRRVLIQVLGVSAYFALIAILYWRGLTDAGAVAIILGLLFFFKMVVSSGTISIAPLFLADPKAKVGSPTLELLKTITYVAVGTAAVVDLRVAVRLGAVPETLATAVIFLTLTFICAACVGCCIARFAIALKNRPRP